MKFIINLLRVTIILANVIPYTLHAQIDSFKIVQSVTPIVGELKSGNISKINSENDQTGRSNLIISFSGASKGFVNLVHNTYPNDIWQRMEWELLEVNFTVEANFLKQIDDILSFRIANKKGKVLFKGMATQQDYGYHYEYNYDRTQYIEQDNQEGILQYSLTDKKITYLEFSVVPSISYPYVEKIIYEEDTINVKIKMPPNDGWVFTGDYSYFSIPQPDFDLIDQFPTANFTYTPENPVAGEPISFDASSSFDPDGGNPMMLAATWDFGDGTTGSGKITNHIYPAPGEYIVCLTIIDIQNLYDKICKKINVAQPPVADFTYVDDGFEKNNKWVIRYKFTDNSVPGYGQKITGYLWDFGDGSEPILKQDPEPVEHVYVKGGTYTVSLTVTNSANQTNKKAIENCVSDIGFRPHLNGWKYTNTTPVDVWPKEHWKKFDYRALFGNNPVWERTFDNSFPPDSIFPDWFLFAETFDFAYSYVDEVTSRYVLEQWRKKSKPWAGSCFGFANSSLLYFGNYLILKNEFPSTNYLYAVSDLEKARNIINKYWLYQFDYRHIEFENTVWGKNVNETVSAIQGNFNLTPDNISVVMGKINIKLINNQLKEELGELHTVVPYKVLTHINDINKLDIYIYDNGVPNDGNRIIEINKLDGTWTYKPYYPDIRKWGFFVNEPVTNFLKPPVLKKSANILSKIQILNSTKNDILINKHDELLGYSLGSLYEKTSYGIMILIIEPYNTNPRPPGYYIDSGEYKAVLDNFETRTTSFSVFTDTLSFFYDRNNVSSDQTDVLLFGPDFLKVVNSDETKKSFNFMCIFNNPANEKVLEFNEVEISPNDTISFYFAKPSEIKMKTLNSSSTYIFRANILTQTKADFYPEKNVYVDANSTHTVIPNWEDINNEGVIIKVDNGNDGTIDETLNLNNFTNISEIDIKLLATVYPNPSNGKFKIECGENVSKAVISVYDMLGSQILNNRLMNLKGTWTYEVDLTSFSNGAYLLKIVTDKKVFEKILMKN